MKLIDEKNYLTVRPFYIETRQCPTGSGAAKKAEVFFAIPVVSITFAQEAGYGINSAFRRQTIKHDADRQQTDIPLQL